MVEAADHGVPGGVDAAVDDKVFLRRYLAHASRELPTHTRDELVGLAHAHRRQGEIRQSGEIQVRLRDVDGETTAIEIITDDAPYLVDSIRSELKVTGHPVENVLHPLLVLTRDESGKITHLFDIDDTAAQPEESITESWIYLEVSLVGTDEYREIEDNLRRVVTDVHYAVRDEPELHRLFSKLADKLSRDPGQFDRTTSKEAGELLRWLTDGNFVILGHASFSSNELASASTGQAAEHQVRGVLRGAATVSPREVLPAYRSGAPVVVFKSPLISTVLRPARYDCVTVMEPVKDGSGTRIHVFLGMFTTSGDTGVARVPVVRRRIGEVLKRSGLRANSHTGRMMVAALRTLPRDELLESDVTSLLKLATLVVNRAERGGIGVFSRVHLNNDFVSVLVYLPQERLGPDTRRHIRDVVAEFWPGRLLSRDDTISELGLARLHFLIALRQGERVPNPNYRDVEARIIQATRGWSDQLADLLLRRVGESEGSRLLRRYERAFPEAYKEDYSTATAVRDIELLESQSEDEGLAFDLCQPGPNDEADRRLKLLRTGKPISLARVLPMLSHLGVEVLDERPYEVDRLDGTTAWIYDFGLKTPTGAELTRQRVGDLIEVLRRLWSGEVEQDGFNGLLLRAGLTWHQIVVLRAYSKYLRQTGASFSQGYIEQTLLENPVIAGALVELFEARFDPSRYDDSAANGTDAQHQAVLDGIGAVASLDQDRILRSLLGLINATLRTSAFQPTLSGQPRVEIAFKLDPKHIEDLPDPKPQFEMWVYSPRVEGVHLRFGPVARGGLRWSDRREDFRTEILGLAKAQAVKNAVIVPVGAKGGFVAKQLPDPSLDRDAWLAEGIACYKTFISCMLDITDDYAHDPETGEQVVIPPDDVIRYDADDAYLVVAADKGTATFSDIANDIAVHRGYWLGDAFASGGSAGYDHKAMGITARGAWESVKYHFRELGQDIQTTDFSVVGVGDMSGDVFGNGMLLSEHIRLVAAFDHRHIFLDPAPDAALAFAERRRMFQLKRSSWDDYDREAISAGGGIYPRTLKSIPISEQVAAALGLPAATRMMTPGQLMHAILLAPVDLLWNGGIGTYVKSAAESDAQVGDKANDGIRADATELRCKVVGEGGNLGCTQRGRIEFARSGGHINTDAIDNSAGVDTSDHEVNIKILLDRELEAGRLEPGERNGILAAATDEVRASVLKDNYLQNVLLGIERQMSVSILPVYQRLMNDLGKRGWLDRSLEFLPSDPQCAQLEDSGLGLVSPELAVVAAYAKITLTRQLRNSDLPADPWFRRALRGYFPASIAERFDATLDAHPLGPDIITTCVVNDMVNRAGTTFAFRAGEERGADMAQVARAYTVLREVFDLETLWNEIEALDNLTPTMGQDACYAEIRRLIDRGIRWLLDVHYPIADIAAQIENYRPLVRELSVQMPQLLRGAERETLYAEVDRLVGLGVPRELALRVSVLLSAFLLLDVVDIAEKTKRSASEVAELHYALSEKFSVDRMLTAVTRLSRDNRWSALARAALRDDVYTALSAITAAVLRSTSAQESVTARMKEWEESNSERVSRTRWIVDDALSRETVDLATLSVALRVMRGLPGRGLTEPVDS